MAKRLFEEERIRAIAAKIRKYDPSWFNGLKTEEMPRAIERVYEIGYADGRQTGYNDGRKAGNAASSKGNYDQGYNEGYDKGYVTGFGAGENLTKLPELTSPGTSEDLISGKQLIDAHRNVVNGALKPVSASGIVVTGTPEEVDTAGGKEIWLGTTYPSSRAYIENGTRVVVNSLARNFGNAPVEAVPEGYTFTSQAGLKVSGTMPRRTADNVGLIGTDIVVPEGYYPEEVRKEIDTGTFYQAGYSAGYSAGETSGYAGGYQVGRDEGYTLGEQEGFDQGRSYGWNEGYQAGISAGTCTHEDGNGVKY